MRESDDCFTVEDLHAKKRLEVNILLKSLVYYII